MVYKKCCVGGCNTTHETHRLFSFPRNDNLRNLWMSFIVPTNPQLIALSKEQLLNKHVCEKHFDIFQFDNEGRRLRYSYPSLLTDNEIAHGVPLIATGWDVTTEHNYCKVQDDDDFTEAVVVIRKPGSDVTIEHNYCKEQNDCSKSSVEIGSSGIDSNVNVVNQMLPKGSTCTKKQKGSVKKIVSRKRKLVKILTNIATETLSDSVSQRLDQAQSLSRNKDLLENFYLLNKQAQTFLFMQLKQIHKSKMARRFTLDEKLMALLIMKQSPKSYKLLEKMFALPSKRTLNRLSEKVSIQPGLNPLIFEHISNTTKKWDTKQKLCTIVFDEVSLTPHLTFNEKDDIINGFVDIAGERKLKYCDHALVFMLRGICSPWRQSVAFYFCEGTVSAAELQCILKQIVPQVIRTGLIPLGLVCDQGSTFRTAIRRLREDTIRRRNIQGVHDDGSVNIADHDLSIFFDPPHLLKGLRNNFLNKDIIWEEKTASWKDIEFIFDLDSKLGHTRALPKLTAHHVDRQKIKKMKVSVAAQVFSARTAAMLKYTNALNYFHTANSDATMATTAEVVEFFDTLFDSVNGYPGGVQRGKLRRAVKQNSQHHTFWIEAINKIKKMVFVDTSSKHATKAGKPRLVRVPSQQGWITTLESFIRVSKLLFEQYNVEYYYPRNINQDPLENFFGRIRAINYRNVNPDANTFIYAFKSLMLSNMLSPHSKFSNCEEDNGETLLNVSLLFKNLHNNKENDSENTVSISRDLPSSSQASSREKLLVNDVVMEKIKVHCSAYTAGYICRKITRAIRCKDCIKTYISSTETNIHSYIKFREYKLLKNNNLAYPNEKFLILYRDGTHFIHNYLNYSCIGSNIKSNLKRKILSTLSFSCLGCDKHALIVKNFFTNILIRLHGHNWCNINNKILKGDIDEKYVSKMGEPQKLALKKYKSLRLRKKCLSK
ncbi:unnamed protein product [Parnassius mnemosyne]|uniref:THAP-type domain-containing protein n=1 Tax=Parnassius mnemosyne TaxID=213953 RepID=A0AAV1KRK4_9NEOP